MSCRCTEPRGQCKKRSAFSLRRRWSLMLVTLMVAGGCSDTEEPDWNANAEIPVAMSPLAGVIGSEPWALDSAEADAQLSDDSLFFVRAYGEDLPQNCEAQVTQAPFVLFMIPTRVGEYPFRPGLNATFVLKDANHTNLVATKGKIVVESVSGSEVEARAFVEYDRDNRLDGRFRVSICQ